MPLTDTAIRAAKPAEKAQKLFDGKGLYLLYHSGRHKKLETEIPLSGQGKADFPLAPTPQLPLKEAREKAMEARKTLENGIDPSAQRKPGQATCTKYL